MHVLANYKTIGCQRNTGFANGRLQPDVLTTADSGTATREGQTLASLGRKITKANSL